MSCGDHNGIGGNHAQHMWSWRRRIMYFWKHQIISVLSLGKFTTEEEEEDEVATAASQREARGKEEAEVVVIVIKRSTPFDPGKYSMAHHHRLFPERGRHGT